MPCASFKGRPAAKPSTAQRWMPRWAGNAMAPSGSIWWTWMLRSAAVPTTNCLPRLSASSTYRLSYPAVFETTSRWPRRWPPDALGSMWALLPWKTRSGVPG
ncbi:Uncharacterised protein [Mycobacterium tuberculosis]|nr:Uncharacterised protein [Mycobacterium tuberculosis]